MNWRDTIISTSITLIVTTAAGIGVVYLTKEPPSSEKIVYEESNVARFEGAGHSTSFFTLSFQNVGKQTAKNVLIKLRLPSGKISDRLVEFPEAPSTAYSPSFSDQSIQLTIPRLVPSNPGKISILVSDAPRAIPIVDVQSEDSLGLSKLRYEELKLKNPINKILSLNLWPIAVIFALVAQVVFGRTYSLLFNKDRIPRPSINNTAFVLIQKGLLDEAIRLLRGAMNRGDAGAVELSNLAAALHLKGDTAEAESYMAAAELWMDDKNAISVVQFNKALIKISDKDYKTAASHLKSACEASPKLVPKYMSMNIYIQKAAKDSPLIGELLTQN